jgi:hypothetical protein
MPIIIKQQQQHIIKIKNKNPNCLFFVSIPGIVFGGHKVSVVGAPPGVPVVGVPEGGAGGVPGGEGGGVVICV